MAFTKSARSPKRRRLKFDRQGGRCWWCGGLMTLTLQANRMPPRNYATFEHLVRRCEGGVGIPNNVVLACQGCNNERHAGDVDRWARPTSGTGWELT